MLLDHIHWTPCQLVERRVDRLTVRIGTDTCTQPLFNLSWIATLGVAPELVGVDVVSDALQVLRAGRLVGRNNEEYRNVWLYVEIQSGNYNTAIEERQRLYGIDKFDRKNAIELARLLAEERPHVLCLQETKLQEAHVADAAAALAEVVAEATRIGSGVVGGGIGGIGGGGRCGGVRIIGRRR